ncbi:PAS domain-containing sensor histidine kinase [Spirosoma pollinicola]|uniref:histidine kinase n=1 Tax=Spirosoma pollinicola TaxID=2057025 RepID=A0A2K8Z467_9BACT|nr:PAS domain-containing sensor histidine kinase [Spirosoma pollinicola]AUD04662.1 hypothetical protein CWM47_24115 [Spirosoma pollinicola]
MPLPQPITSAADLYQHLDPAVLEDIYQHAPVGYHSLDAKGRIMLINDTELSWLGYAREEVIGKLFLHFFPPSQHQLCRERFATFQQTGKLSDARFTFVRKDGSCFPILLNVTAIYADDGQLLLTRSVVLDLSVQYKLETVLFEKKEELKLLNEQLISLNQTKSRFVEVVAHDLQNPITNLRMLAAKLRKAPEPLTPRQYEWVNEIDETAHRMGRLIQQTLDVNRIEQNQNAPHCKLMDVQPLLASLLKQFTYPAERKMIRLRLLNEQHEAYANTDISYLTGILENLVANALKFSPAGKTVWVIVQTKESALQIIVADEGPGIPLTEQPLLFKRFVSLSPKPTADESSAGLGLSIAKDYADQIGATLQYEHRPEAGATFVLRLPLQSQLITQAS